MILDRKPPSIERLLNDKAKQIVNKGSEISDVDLYNLCLLNIERDEIAKEKKPTLQPIQPS